MRNAIYERVYDEPILLEVLPQKLFSRRFLKPSPPNIQLDILRVTDLRNKIKRPAGYSNDWTFSVPKLYLVNRLIAAESVAFIYQRITLFAQSLKPLHAFMTSVPATSLMHIHSLRLIQATYGEPDKLCDALWKQKADQSWVNTLARIVKSMPNLHTVRISLQIFDLPFRLALTEPWVEPLLTLSQLPTLSNLRIRIEGPIPRRLRAFIKDYTDSRRGQLTAAGRQYVDGLEVQFATCVELHNLLGNAIAVKILTGADDEVAMVEMRERIEELEDQGEAQSWVSQCWQ
jgi:hypothetical protein